MEDEDQVVVMGIKRAKRARAHPINQTSCLSHVSPCRTQMCGVSQNTQQIP